MWLQLLIPFLGTIIGASFVFFIKDELPARVQKSLLGFASGVMVAASVWSLLMPSMEMTGSEGWHRVLPAAVGVLAGMAALLLIDRFTPHQHVGEDCPEGPNCKASKSTMLALAVTIHNLPEGMAMGVVMAAALERGSGISMAAALAVSVGIAIQNMPEGAIVSLPLRVAGGSKWKAFALGAMSGAVEPVGAVLVLLLASRLTPVMPYFLAFAAGAMLYVVVEELIPETAGGEHSNVGTIGFAAGFVLMMVLDVVLG